MISIDTNILLYAINASCPEHASARRFLTELANEREVVLAELVLVELYLLLRNPAVVAKPLGSADAVAVCEGLRSQPHWRLVDAAPIMDRVWQAAKADGFARRRIIDVRLALTLQHHGVTDFATRNVADFADLGFQRVWSPV